MEKSLKTLIAKLLSAHADTGWVQLSTSPNIWYRKVGNIVYLQGYSINCTHVTVFYTLPSGLRPAMRHTVPAAFPLTACVYVNIETDGTIQGVINGGGTISMLYFATQFPVAD